MYSLYKVIKINLIAAALIPHTCLDNTHKFDGIQQLKDLCR